MLKRPAQKNLSAEAQKTITRASAQQTGKSQVLKTYDINYPVFDTPVNQKVLVYIPNHTVQNEDGVLELRKDKFAAYPVFDGRTYENVRSVEGIEIPELGLDKSCPFRGAINECWELVNLETSDIARGKGLDPNASDINEVLKEDRKKLMNAMAVKNPEVWYTFPIVLIDCEEKDGKLTTIPKKDAEGKINGTPMWYSIRERTYLDKWSVAFDSIETEDGSTPDNPAGMWAILNFTYTVKNGKHDKMGSAKALTVSFKPMQGYEQWAEYFDQMTAEWTPELAQQVVVLDAIRSMDEMNEAVDTIMRHTRDKLAMYRLSARANASNALPVSNSADMALASFGSAPPNLTQETPNVGIMPQ